MTRSFPDWPGAPVELALSLYKAGRMAEAIPILEKAIERFGNSPLFRSAWRAALASWGIEIGLD